jgi:sterol desaturase/sphingolipid hydroxylase (fatty acid hydroxylase superfamily)
VSITPVLSSSTIATFAAGTTLWDQLFGSYEGPEPHPEPELGVGEARVPGGESILRRLAWP